MSVKKTILLVDSDSVTARAERAQLEKHGYAVITAKTGEDAVGKFRARPDIELALMDVRLGAGLDGIDAAEIILKEKDLPVVFLYDRTAPDAVGKTERIASYGFAAKNDGIAALDAAIKVAFRLFDERKKARESETRYRRLVEITPDAIFINQGGRIVFVN